MLFAKGGIGKKLMPDIKSLRDWLSTHDTFICMIGSPNNGMCDSFGFQIEITKMEAE